MDTASSLRMPSLHRPESSTSLRPASISQPNVHASLDLNNVPQELQLVFGLLSLQAQRPYCDGYVLRKHVNLPGIYPLAFEHCIPFPSSSVYVLWDRSLISRRQIGSGSRMVRVFRPAKWNNSVIMGCSGCRRSSVSRRSNRYASIHQHH